jgi:hypothetical protein
MGGAFSPKLNSKGDIYYLGYNENGYDVYQLENTNVINTPKILSLDNTPVIKHKYPRASFEIADYSSTSHLKPSWWTPTLSKDDDSLLLGVYTSGSDALNRHAYDAYLGFDFQSTSLSGEFNYSYDRWFPTLQTHLETVGRESSRNDTYQFEMLTPLFTRDYKVYLGIDMVYEKFKNTITQNNGSEITDTNIDPLLGAGIIFDSRRQEILSVSPTGRLVSLTAESSDIFGGNTNGQMLVAKWKEYVSFKPQHVLAFRFIGGFGLQNPRPFQLGGSISDHEYRSASLLSTLPIRASLYNKRRYAFRGYPSDAASLIGRRMVMYDLEWRFPLKRIERSLYMLPLGLHQISSTLFAGSASTWQSGNTPENYHYNLGAELHFHTEWFYFLPLKVRLGYAYGLDEDGEHQVYFSFSSSF